ncbi:hypothetical protein BROUX41_005227 [Berkeleyomyces rouxiae]|uniref:uncharacterized protein n=1 Tax=Berkeleyomyces rouxiae TaxID=2035830 RepID=UPI003B7E4C83
MSSYINTTTSGYAILGVLTVLTLFLMSKKQQPAATPMVARVAASKPATAPKAKKQRSKAYSNKAAAAPADPTPELPATSTTSTGTTKDEISNDEFARQMAGLKEGTSLASKASTASKSKKKSKTKKAKAAQEIDFDDEATAPSTSTGRDADEDQSPATSPEVKPTDSTGVADMLEKSAAAPSVLRLTETNTAPVKTSKSAKTEAPVETKKQRQNRKKAEAAKALRAETEKERQIQLEAQRRTARIAEGRPAKDGSQFAAQQKAWTESSSSVTAAPAVLDTFEAPAAVPATQAEKPVPVGLSEEELIEMAKEDSSEWNTVNKKSKKSKKVAPIEEVQPEAVPETKTVPSGNVSSAPVSKPVATVSKPVVLKSFGSFTALSADEQLPNESEWDV